MSTADDLRELCDELDAALTGWLRPSYSLMTTQTGKKAEQLVKQLRQKYYDASMKHSTIEMKLHYALLEVEGMRAQNALLTEALDNCERYKNT